MNLSELKALNSGYDEAHREVSNNEQENPCTCQRNGQLAFGGVSYPSLVEPSYADPDCELHFPWMQEDEASRIHAMRYWFAGYHVGFDTGFKTGKAAAMEQLGYLAHDSEYEPSPGYRAGFEACMAKMMQFLEVDTDG